MARASALATLCVLAMLCCVALQCVTAFLPGPVTRGVQSDAAIAVATAGLAAATSLPDTASAFVYDNQEYFDITFGISPLYWGLAAFGILVYGAVVKNAALKYNKPYGTTTIVDPTPEKTDAYKGTIEEFGPNPEAEGKYAGY